MTTTDFQFAVRGGFHAVRVLRRHLADWMQEIGIARPVIEDVQLAVSELAANAIEASPLGEADIEGVADATRLRMTVTNTARQFFHWRRDEEVGRDRQALAPRGRGLQIVAAISDSLDITTTGNRTRATLTKRLVADVPVNALP